MNLDSNKSTEKNTSENMMVQLLFKNRPKSPTTEQLRKALEKYLGDLGEVPYVEPSGESSGNMFMFPVSKYTAAFEDKPDGVPVIATFLSSETDSGIDVDDMKRRQFWDVPNGNDIISECKNTILVYTMLGRALPYMQQAEILLAQVGAAIDDKVVGFILGTSMLFHYGRTFEINDLAVNPAFQRRGIAKQLLERCLSDIKEQGMVGVHLITAGEGILPVFYEKYGFKKENEVILMGLEL